MRMTKLEKNITKNLDGMVKAIYEAKEKDLRTTLTNINKYGATNCGWASFWAKSLIVKFIVDAISEAKLKATKSS